MIIPSNGHYMVVRDCVSFLLLQITVKSAIKGRWVHGIATRSSTG